ncbi:MAG: GT2 family glycosyltransferase [Candidatus Endobugula sp.]|jgi:GT2 family glycosyltransferase
MTNILSVIVTYNASEWLDVCIGSLLRSSVPTDIALVDNNSSDNTIGLIEKLYEDELTYFYSLTENMGFGKAHNYLFSRIDLTKYDYVFLLNQDAEISPSGISKLLKVAQAESGFGVLSPVHYFIEGEMDRWFANYFNHFVNERLTIANERVRTVRFVNAAIWLMRTDSLRAIGGFEPLFSHYGEDLNYVQRLHHIGLKSVIVESATGYHYRKQDSTGLDKKSDIDKFCLNQLISLLNPENSFFKEIILFFAKVTKLFLLKLWGADFFEIKAISKTVIELVGKLPEIKESRRSWK